MGYTVNEMKRMNKQAGGFFFQPETMRFFESKVISKLTNDVGIFFTSEKFEHKERRYNVRIFTPNGQVNTVGPFDNFNYRQAQVYASKVSKALRQAGNREKAVLNNLSYVGEWDGNDECLIFMTKNGEESFVIHVEESRIIQ